jgi:transcriptional regulator with XRE-family HTH domain
MQTIGKRIRQIRTQLSGTSQEEFADLMCMTQSNLSMIETQKFLPSCQLLYRLHTTYQVNVNWILTGKGEMIVVTPACTNTLS